MARALPPIGPRGLEPAPTPPASGRGSTRCPRREIHEGLNVIENWNGANDFILYGRGGEICTNRVEEQEIIMLALHRLQVCLVHVNTLMMQRVLTEPD